MRARFYNPQAGARENEATSHNLLSPRLQVQELPAGDWRARKALRQSRPAYGAQKGPQRKLRLRTPRPGRSKRRTRSSQRRGLPRSRRCARGAQIGL